MFIMFAAEEVSAQFRCFFVCNYISRIITLCYKYNIFHAFSCLVLPYQAVLVEIHPSYRQDRHFRHASRMTGKLYLPMRSTQRETCVGSSDTITVPIDEFQRTMDGALRLAR
jgi:hypothetical protein